MGLASHETIHAAQPSASLDTVWATFDMDAPFASCSTMDNPPSPPTTPENPVMVKRTPKPSTKMSFKQRQRLLQQLNKTKNSVKKVIEEVSSSHPRLSKWMFYDIPEFNKLASTSDNIEEPQKENIQDPDIEGSKADRVNENTEMNEPDATQVQGSFENSPPPSSSSDDEGNHPEMEKVEGHPMQTSYGNTLAFEAMVGVQEVKNTDLKNSPMSITTEAHTSSIQCNLDIPVPDALLSPDSSDHASHVDTEIVFASHSDFSEEPKRALDVSFPSEHVEIMSLQDTEAPCAVHAHAPLANVDPPLPLTLEEASWSSISTHTKDPCTHHQQSTFIESNEKHVQSLPFTEKAFVEHPTEHSETPFTTFDAFPLEHIDSETLVAQESLLSTCSGCELDALHCLESPTHPTPNCGECIKVLDTCLPSKDEEDRVEKQCDIKTVSPSKTQMMEPSFSLLTLEKKENIAFLKEEESLEGNLDTHSTNPETFIGSSQSNDTEHNTEILESHIPNLLLNSSKEDEESKRHIQATLSLSDIDLTDAADLFVVPSSSPASVSDERDHMSTTEFIGLNQFSKLENFKMNVQEATTLETPDAFIANEEHQPEQRVVEEKVGEMDQPDYSCTVEISSKQPILHSISSETGGDHSLHSVVYLPLQAKSSFKIDATEPLSTRPMNIDLDVLSTSSAFPFSCNVDADKNTIQVAQGPNETETLSEISFESLNHEGKDKNAFLMSAQKVENQILELSPTLISSCEQTLNVKEEIQENESSPEESLILDVNKPKEKEVINPIIIDSLSEGSSQIENTSEASLVPVSETVSTRLFVTCMDQDREIHSTNNEHGNVALVQEPLPEPTFDKQLESISLNNPIDSAMVSTDVISGFSDTDKLSLSDLSEVEVKMQNERSVQESQHTAHAEHIPEMQVKQDSTLEEANILADLITSDLMDVCPSHPFDKVMQLSNETLTEDTHTEVGVRDKINMSESAMTDLENKLPHDASFSPNQEPKHQVDVDTISFTLIEKELPTFLKNKSDVKIEDAKIEDKRTESEDIKATSHYIEPYPDAFETEPVQQKETLSSSDQNKREIGAFINENENLETVEPTHAMNTLKKPETHSSNSQLERSSPTIAAIAAEDEVLRSMEHIDSSTFQARSSMSEDINESVNPIASQDEVVLDEESRRLSEAEVNFEENPNALESILSIFHKPGMPPVLEIAMHTSFFTFIIILFVISYFTWGHSLSYYSLFLALINIVIWVMTSIVNVQNRIQLSSAKEKVD